MFLDSILGNEDRISARVYNAGNIMILENSSDAQGRSIALIDHDFHLNAYNYARVEGNLKSLLDGSALDKIIKNLLEEIPEDQVDVVKMREEFIIGIQKAKEAFKKLSEVEIMEIFDIIPSDPNVEQPDIQSFKKLIASIIKV